MDEPIPMNALLEPESARHDSQRGTMPQRSLWQWTLGSSRRIPLDPSYMSQLNKFERLQDFSYELPPDAERETAADRVRASFEVVSLTVSSDYRPREELRRDLNEFIRLVVSTPYWYTYGDLFEFSDLHLEDLFYPKGYGETYFHPVRDPEHFVKHLQSVLRPNCHAFVHKIAVFVKSLCIGGHNLEAFLLLASMLSNLQYINVTVLTGLKRQMQRLLEMHLKNTFETPMWGRIPMNEVSRFLDKPAAYRRLHADTCNVRLRPSRTTRLLEVLEKQAWRRIRLNVYLACRSRLPPELVETVFEHSLRKEGIPLDPRSPNQDVGVRASSGP